MGYYNKSWVDKNNRAGTLDIEQIHLTRGRIRQRCTVRNELTMGRVDSWLHERGNGCVRRIRRQDTEENRTLMLGSYD